MHVVNGECGRESFSVMQTSVTLLKNWYRTGSYNFFNKQRQNSMIFTDFLKKTHNSKSKTFKILKTSFKI
jgi:hypothetical protein